MTGWCGCGLTSGSSIRCRLTAPWRQIRLGARRRAPSIAASPLVPTSSRFPQPPACLALYSLPQACLKLASLLRSSCASCSPSPLPPALREPVRPITAPLSLYPVSPPHHPPIEPPYCPYTPTPHSLPTPFLLPSYSLPTALPLHNSLYSFPVGLVGCPYSPCINDHMAFMPRALAPKYFAVNQDFRSCGGWRNLSVHWKNYNLWRLQVCQWVNGFVESG